MPEGDTIWRSAASLRRRLCGREVSAARPAALGRLSGRRLLTVEPVGKHLYMRFDGDLVLHTHMRMTGAWHVYAVGEPWRRARHLATAVLAFDGLEAVLFAAPVCELVTPAQMGAGLGPDVLAPGFDPAVVATRARSSSRASIGEVLLDQSVCAGIGNMHRCNALWCERVDPFAPMPAIDDPTLVRVISRARDLIRRGAVGDAFASRGAVHGRTGRPCPECGTPIRSQAHGRPARIVYWCERCQRAGTPALDGG